MRIDELRPGKIVAPKSYGSTEDQFFAPAKKYITRHCGQALEIMRAVKNPLFRGIDIRVPYFFGHPRENRPSFGGDPDLMELIDGKLASAGFKALRHNSIMCSGSATKAFQFGETYLVFPRDGFDFTWSPEISDANFYEFTPKEYIQKATNSAEFNRLKNSIMKTGLNFSVRCRRRNL